MNETVNTQQGERPPILAAETLHKSFRTGSASVPVLTGIDVVFREGVCYTIQGVSGSGKTTLLHLLAGLEDPDTGQILYRNQDISRFSRKRLAAWRGRAIGLVFQAYHLLPELTALENVNLPAMLFGQRDPKPGWELLEAVGMTHRWQHRPWELSGGEQQRVAIARALRNDPEILMADEPTGNLDEETGLEVIDLLLDLQKSRGKTLVLATHDPRLAQKGDQQLVLTGGKLERVDPTSAASVPISGPPKHSLESRLEPESKTYL
ncbi:Lipoprotein-releasing system ATP-binding protein LolD [Methylacidimicrobium cyclopophantes]|uniref:Lipoprotein-releasing system ATP-binding protein LolD n=1 Tax=Methylacidimicrobium cyclopophantes TaxID=1041766 RepID=A0A5E6M7X8_9BACT|nr:ABC transporter ATP-binding protein [Methylacidimicrobium cyclopophantes]VVM05042.1 Lipoprotein-releasing system ATP-binding protein LolD [Methylacidimicrobium cyclopophantes]